VIDSESPPAVLNRAAVAREAATAASQTVERVLAQLDDVERPLRAPLAERVVLLAEDGLVDADATTAPLPEQLSAIERCVAEAAASWKASMRVLPARRWPASRSRWRQAARGLSSCVS